MWRGASWCRRVLDLPLHPLLVAGGLLAIVVALNLHAPAQPTLLQRALASLLIGLCAIPSLMWASNRHWPHALLPHAGVLYAACFALPVLLLPRFAGTWPSSPRLDGAIDGALVLAVGGWIALMIGHFVMAGWLTRTLPRVEVAPGPLQASDSSHARGAPSRAARERAAPAEGSFLARGAPSRSPAEGSFLARGAPSRSPAEGSAKTIAAVAACIGVPCFYLDNAAVLAHYTGRALLPDAVAFPIAFAGQAVVFAVLVLFHLHLRGQLGVMGRACLIVLTVYYTLLGCSTGMANHGLKALFGLFAAYAVVAHRPTWRYMACGALVAVFLLLVVLPGRYHYRQLVWTHGVDPAGAPPGLGHEFQVLPGAELEQVVKTPAYSVTLKDGALTYAHHDPMVCKKRGVVVDFLLFVHVHPVDLDDLPYERRRYGFSQRDVSAKNGAVVDGQCVYNVPLPDHAIRLVRVGLYRYATSDNHETYMSGRLELAAPASDTAMDVDSKGEWHLATRNATTWKIAPASPAHSRLRVAVADEEEQRQITKIGANNRIRVEIDQRNWAEYVVSSVRISGQLATFRLSELHRLQGDPSALQDGAAATLRYEQVGPIVAALAWPGQRPREGTNPAAPEASRSLASSAVIYAKGLLPLAFTAGSQTRFQKTVQRFDRLLPVAWIMENTPARVPHLRGETLRPLLYKLVPRAAFDDKPEDSLSPIEQSYRLVMPGDSMRHFKVHQLGELYANFGATGAVLGLLALGLLLRVIHHLFHHASASAATMAGGTHLLVVLVLEMESILSVSWGFVAWYLIALLALAASWRLGRRWFERLRAPWRAPRTR